MRPFLTLHQPGLARDYYRRGLWTDDTAYGLMAAHAAARPEDPAYRDGALALTWRELKERVDVFAAALLELGLVPGDRVSIWMSNRVEPVLAFLACSRGGHAVNPSLHRTHACTEIGELLRRIDRGGAADRTRLGAGPPRRRSRGGARIAADAPQGLHPRLLPGGPGRRRSCRQRPIPTGSPISPSPRGPQGRPNA